MGVEILKKVSLILLFIALSLVNISILASAANSSSEHITSTANSLLNSTSNIVKVTAINSTSNFNKINNTINLSSELINEYARLNKSQELVNRMAFDGFSVQRLNDSLLLIGALIDTQKMIEVEGGKTDFSLIDSKFSAFDKLVNLAYSASDELVALEQSISQQTYLHNDSEIYKKLFTAKENLNSERYEQTLTLIDEIYSDLSELNAFNIKVAAAYDLASRNFTNFLKSNWKVLLISVVIIYVLYVVSINRIICYFLKKKISLLELRRDAVKSLIMKVQKEYFQKKTLGEMTYAIRIRKYAELTRDINRQISVCKEELAFKRGLSFLSNKKYVKKN
jgi:hypothetical protein